MNTKQARNVTNEFLQEKKGIEYIDLLREVIRFHDYLYRVCNDPIIDDTMYDRLFSLLLDREKKLGKTIPKDSPTQLIGEQILSHFDKSTHRVPMFSLQNTYTSDEIYEWGTRTEKMLAGTFDEGEVLDITYTIEPKLDGSSIQIVYKYGNIYHAATRGNGYTGEDITEHIKRISNLPHYIKEREYDEEIILRAEVVMPQEAFERVNQEQSIKGEKLFANARNAAAGVLRNLDVSLVYRRGLVCYVFEVLSTRSGISQASIALKQMKEYGIPVHPWNASVSSIDQVVNICNDEDVRKITQYGSIACDGLVIKVDQYVLREVLGFTEHHPRRAFAFKYPAQEVVAYLDTIDWQVGRTGIITPVANLHPVSVGGVIVQKATLHNASFIIDRNLFPGQEVWIKRSGEVIPYVIGPVESGDGNQEGELTFPQNCPVCGESTMMSEDYKRLLCVNLHCSAQQKERLKHYVSRDAADIDGLGGKSIELLYDYGLVSTIESLYELNSPINTAKAINLQGIGAIKRDKILQGIEQSKKRKFHELFYGLGVNGIGKKLAKILTEYYASQQYKENHGIVDHLVQYTKQDILSGIYGIGEEIANTLVRRIGLKETRKALHSLEKFGVLTIEKLKNYSQGVSELQNEKFFGKIFVITGSFEISRNKIVEYIEAQGGTVSSAVSSRTDYVLVGENAGSKVKKAVEVGVSLLQGEELKIFLGEILLTQANVNKLPSTKQQGLFE